MDKRKLQHLIERIYSIDCDYCVLSHCEPLKKNELLAYLNTLKIIKNFPYLSRMAKPAEPVNGQDERRINAPPLTAPPVFAKG